MEIKDYYSTLELLPTASPDDIKKAYRRLAQQYHPDKTGDDPRARAQFNAIKEAYETLTTPHRREAYLQERWLAQSQGLKDHWVPSTPEALLQKLLTLEKKTVPYRWSSGRLRQLGAAGRKLVVGGNIIAVKRIPGSGNGKGRIRELSSNCATDSLSTGTAPAPLCPSTLPTTGTNPKNRTPASEKQTLGSHRKIKTIDCSHHRAADLFIAVCMRTPALSTS